MEGGILNLFVAVINFCTAIALFKVGIKIVKAAKVNTNYLCIENLKEKKMMYETFRHDLDCISIETNYTKMLKEFYTKKLVEIDESLNSIPTK